MKKTLGLDLGTNSIGWAVVSSETDENNVEHFKKIESCGSRIIPMDSAMLSDFSKGNSVSQTKDRTKFRGARRLSERHLLRRERLNRVLDLLGFLPPHYADQLDRYGKIKEGKEPKLAWRTNEFGRSEFLFRDSFNEMLEAFRTYQPERLAKGEKIPYDWTIYYLRKKALTDPITKEELAWILLNFNQKRGYNQLRGEEEEENTTKQSDFYALKVVDVEDTGEKKGKEIWYNVHLENGWIYRRSSNIFLDWVGKTKEFIVTTSLGKDGLPKKEKDGSIKRSFRAPKEDDWALLKKKTEYNIDTSGKTLGAYIYDILMQTPNQKIRGKIVRTVERKYYRQELQLILNKQATFIPELQNRTLYNQCLQLLYPSNEAHRINAAKQDFKYLFIDDILFYQRPLKSKKSLISDCPYEYNTYKDTTIGALKRVPLKCIAKSHPLYQEFRLWQFVDNLKIYQREKIEAGEINTDVPVTEEFLPDEEAIAALFEWLNNRKEIDQETLFSSYFFKIKKLKKDETSRYRWNYVQDKQYPCNTTHAEIHSRLAKAGIDEAFLTPDVEESLWHILYSVDDKVELGKALGSFAEKHGLSGSFVEAFKKCPPFAKEYGAYSAKATKRLLTLMRMSKYWKECNIDTKTKQRIQKIIDGEYDPQINDRLREYLVNYTDIKQFHSMPLWLACYIVYGRFSEAKTITKWEQPEDIDHYLSQFKQYSLRNPIVEQVVTETLRTVRDIWKKEGQIDEIHIELGRDMKSSADKRKIMTERNIQNENTNLRIKTMLAEFSHPEYGIANVRPYSPMQQEIMHIYEEYALTNLQLDDSEYEFVDKMSRTAQPSASDVQRYKLWLEQRYQSPYTGAMIPLNKLFTPAYEIEHIIPQSRYFDDSFNNKVICEARVNQCKGNALGYEFIKNHHGQKVTLDMGKEVEVFSVEAYEEFVRAHYSRNRSKMQNLLMDDIPDHFIERQLNDSRYISVFIKALLSNIVRQKDTNGDYEPEAMSRNVISCTGAITDRLKKDWGIVDVWNKIILPRFQRLNGLTHSSNYTSINTQGNEIPTIPLEQAKGFNKKRIDHRHHAMDAIVIACAGRNIVNYLNNASACKDSKTTRYDLQQLLCVKNELGDRIVHKPWEMFTQDVYVALSEIVISFKNNVRVVNKTTNRYQHYNSLGEKKIVLQTSGDNFAIRKPMHKDTVFGEVNLRKVKKVSFKEALNNVNRIVDQPLKQQLKKLVLSGYDNKRITKYIADNPELFSNINLAKIEVYYFSAETKDRYFATRKPIDTSFDEKKILEKVTDTGAQKILLGHLRANNGDTEVAFSADGIEQMNQNIRALNNGKFHQPLMKVRVYEKAEKFSIGQKGSKNKKFVEAQKGTNLFFAVYADKEGKRSYATIPLNVVIERLKLSIPPVPEINEVGSKLLFSISPNDLVYLPTPDDVERGSIYKPLDKSRIYKMVSTGDVICYFIPYYVAIPIIDKFEYESHNKMAKALPGEMIKETCVPIKVDRLGNVVEINKQKV